MTLEGITTCVFDINGVLIDSNRANATALARAFTQDAAVQDRIVSLYLQLTGIDRGTKIRKVQDRVMGRPFEKGEFQRVWDRVRIFTRDAMVGAPLLPGCRETLTELGRRGLKRVALSNTPGPELKAILAAKRLDALFDVIRGGGDRPKAESLMRVIEELALDASTCLFIGDGKGDYLAATRAGIRFIAIDPGTGEFDTYDGFEGPYRNLAHWGREALGIEQGTVNIEQ
jgi:phosphoglycolate phosphatase-like HAD superfamily hydrolase